MEDTSRFKEAISVLSAAKILLEEKRKESNTILDAMALSGKIAGLELAIQCLEEVQK